MHHIWLSHQLLPMITKTNSYHWRNSQKLQNQMKKLGDRKPVNWNVKTSGTMEDKLMAVNETLKWQWELKLLKAQQTSKQDSKQTSAAVP